MPLLVGETELAGRGGVFGGRLNALVVGMMLLTLCVHGFVLFSGESQHEALSYALYRARTSALIREKQTGEESSRRQANVAGDLFADWVGQRDLYIGRYPQARLPQPHWGTESIEVLNSTYGYQVIDSPAGARPWSPGGREATAASVSPSVGGPSSGQAATAAADDLRDAHERRVKESEAEVVAD